MGTKRIEFRQQALRNSFLYSVSVCTLLNSLSSEDDKVPFVFYFKVICVYVSYLLEYDVVL